MTNEEELPQAEQKQTTKRGWTWKRKLIVLLAVLFGLPIGFELWRQWDISSERKSFQSAASVEQAYEPYRKSLLHGQDGTDAYRDFLDSCNESDLNSIGAGFTIQRLTSRTPIGSYETNDYERSILNQWQAASQPIVDSFIKASESDSIAISAISDRPIGFEYRWGIESQLTPDTNIPCDHMYVLFSLGQHDKALEIYDAMLRMSQALESSSSQDQLALYVVRTGCLLNKQTDLAAAGLLDKSRLTEALAFRPAWNKVLEQSINGSIMAVSEDIELALPSGANGGSWFAWAFPSNYNKFRKQDLYEQTFLLAGQLESASNWLIHSRGILNSGEVDDATIANWYFDDTELLDWRWVVEWGEETDKVIIPLRDAVCKFRLLELDGKSIADIRAELNLGASFKLTWTDDFLEIGISDDDSTHKPVRLMFQLSDQDE